MFGYHLYVKDEEKRNLVGIRNEVVSRVFIYREKQYFEKEDQYNCFKSLS